jgi:AGCS family alanine or glycine:cation symporter
LSQEFTEVFKKCIQTFNSYIWTPIYVMLFVIGIYFTFRTNFMQFRKFKFVIENTLGKVFKKSDKSKENSSGISSWQAVTTALGSTIGTGNIVGVTTAIVTGGPGSIFWMWLFAAIGMMTKYSEIVLAIKYREKNKAGEWAGGPMYYMKNGLHWNFYGKISAFLLAVGAITAGFLVQINSIALSLNDFGMPKITSGIIFTIVVGLVIIGGVKRIGSFAEKVVPFMGILYIVGSLAIILFNIRAIPAAFVSIFKDAFAFKKAAGGFIGYSISSAMHYGIARGTSSSECGLGSAPVVHAAANVDHPVKQGIYGILEVFFSSFVICTATALVILTAGVYNSNTYDAALSASGIEGLNGLDNAVTIVAKSFSSVLGNKLGSMFLTTSIIFFSVTTIIGWGYYGIAAVEFLWNKKVSFVYKIICLASLIVGSVLDVNLIWELCDTTNALMTILNLIAVIALSPVVLSLTKEFFSNKANN